MVADLGSRANEATRWKQVTSVEIRSTLSSSDGPLARLRFLGRVAHAGDLGAARAALTIFAAHGRVEVDPPDVGQSGQPGQHVRHLRGQFFLIAGPDRRGELSELLGQPEKRGRVAARRVLGSVHLKDHLLKRGESQTASARVAHGTILQTLARRVRGHLGTPPRQRLSRLGTVTSKTVTSKTVTSKRPPFSRQHRDWRRRESPALSRSV